MRNKLSNVLWGLFFILIGVGIAGNVMNIWDFHLFFDGWWTLLIIVPCFISMLQTGFSTGSTIGFIIGVLLLMNYQVDFHFNIWQLIIPVILVFIGIRIMFQGAFHKKINYENSYSAGPNSNMNGSTNGTNYTNINKGEYSAVFSSNHIHITEPFYGTSLSAAFGAIVLDLRDAQITGDVEINASAIFGGIDMYLPNGVKLKTSNVPIFGGVSNKHTQPADPGAPTVYLNSTCMFGGIDIK
ncbi:MAG: putative rane protein [Herbinix sp.]|jgi:predicted membrane protein|nr:putative rane protein [Herbinix sp.]